MRSATPLVVTLVVVAVLISGCGGRLNNREISTTTSQSTAPSTTTGTSVPAIKAGTASAAVTIDASLTTTDGRERTYHLYVPASITDSDPLPLLVALHGGTGSGTQFEKNSGFDALAEANGFIVVYPDGIPIGNSDSRVWNGGNCCGPAQSNRLNVDDVGFISELLDVIEAQHPVDPDRVYATGHSNGAIMSYRLACELSDRIVAVGFQAGSLEIDACPLSHPVSVFHIHGTADQNLPIDGGRGEGISNADFRSPKESIATLAELDGCPGPTETVDVGNPDVSYEVREPCRDGTTVEMAIVAGASHAWMGHPSTLIQRALAGTPYQGYDASFAIWSFLAAHPRR